MVFVEPYTQQHRGAPDADRAYAMSDGLVRRSLQVSFITTAVFAAVSAVALWGTVSDYRTPGHGGWLVTDVVNLSRDLTWLNGGTSVPALSWGFIALYAWTWELSPALCGLINLAILLFSAYLLADVLRRRGIDSRYAAPALLINPYLWLVSPGPNKDIPSLGFSMLVLWITIARPRLWAMWALMAAAGAASLRDGWGVILGLYVVTAVVLRPPALRAAAGFLAAGAAAGVLPLLAEVAYFVRRNVEAGALAEKGAGGGLIGGLLDDTTNPLLAYPLRIGYNALTAALFPVFTTADGGPYWLGVAFWVFGLGLLGSLVACAYVLVHEAPATMEAAPLAGFFLFSLFGVSAAPFVQPRYLMATFPAACVVLLSLRRSSRALFGLVSVAAAILFVLAYNALGRAPPSAKPEEVPRPPAYLEYWNP